MERLSILIMQLQTAARAVTKMRHYAHSLQEAGVVLSDLILVS